MTEIIEEDAATWPRCTRCDHRVRPSTQVCDEAWRHSPCDIERGCIPDRPLFDE